MHLQNLIVNKFGMCSSMFPFHTSNIGVWHSPVFHLHTKHTLSFPHKATHVICTHVGLCLNITFYRMCWCVDSQFGPGCKISFSSKKEETNTCSVFFAVNWDQCFTVFFCWQCFCFLLPYLWEHTKSSNIIRGFLYVYFFSTIFWLFSFHCGRHRICKHFM